MVADLCISVPGAAHDQALPRWGAWWAWLLAQRSCSDPRLPVALLPHHVRPPGHWQDRVELPQVASYNSAVHWEHHDHPPLFRLAKPQVEVCHAGLHLQQWWMKATRWTAAALTGSQVSTAGYGPRSHGIVSFCVTFADVAQYQVQ